MIKWKESHDEDSRALLQKEFKAFLGEDKNKPLDRFVQLVRDNPELELCFRGNSDSSPRISIYENNHIIFTVLTSGMVKISFNHARYYKNWKSLYDSLIDYGFSGKIEDEDGFIDIGEMTRSTQKKGALTYDQIKDIYKNILKPMFGSYFKAAEKKSAIDYFKKEEKVTVSGKKEKVEQQNLYRRFVNTHDGYYFYDLEFAQRHENMSSLLGDKNNNKPDMWGLHFGAEMKPDRIVVVEVKCTEAAMKGGSGIVTHLQKMKNYDKLPERRKEACQLMNHYAMLELRGLNNSIEFDYDDFKKLPVEIMLIFTDDAARIWEEDASFAADRKKTKEIPAPVGVNAKMYVVC